MKCLLKLWEAKNIYKIKYNIIAKNDLIKTYYYIFYSLCNPIVANRLLSNIILFIENLEQFPYMGTIYSNNIRFIIYKNFLIFYEIQQKEKIIIIRRIIHKNMNIRKK